MSETINYLLGMQCTGDNCTDLDLVEASSTLYTGSLCVRGQNNN